MTKTKRTFLYAGSILGIISAIFMLFAGVMFFAGATVTTKDLFVDTYYEDTSYIAYDSNNLPTENKDEIAYFEDKVSGEKHTIEDIEISAKLIKTIMMFFGFILVGLGVAELTFGIIVINTATKGSKKLASIVTLLILSAISGNMLTMAFMIVGLCLKNKPEIENEPSIQNLN